MLPPWLPSDVVSGERTLFNALRDDPGTADWIVLHSYGLARHATQRRGEIDFVIVAPGFGVLVVEVKSHSSVSYEHGVWQLGQETPPSKNPITQVQGNMYSLLEIIKGRGQNTPIIDYCVVFPNARLNGSSPEWNDWQIIDQSKGAARGFAASIRAALEGMVRASRFSGAAEQFTADRARRLAEFLRPRFDSPESLHSRSSALDAEYATFLEDQFEALDQLESSGNMLFEGAAGTGKTLLALELAERNLHSGRRVVVLCYNRMLAQFLQATLGEHGGLVFCGTVGALAHSIVKESDPKWNGNQNDLIGHATELLLDIGISDYKFDVLIVDETQDLADESTLEFLEILVHSCDKPSTVFFADFDHQKVYFGQDDGFHLLRSIFPDLARHRLYSNCRNRPGFENLFDRLCGFGGLYRRYRLPDAGPVFQFLPVEDPASHARVVEASLDGLLKEFLPGEIAILGITPFQDVAALPQSLRDRIAQPDKFDFGQKKVISTTIRKFKGLESKALILHDFSVAIDPELLYAGLTRAIERIVILCARNEITDLAVKLAPRFEGEADG
jgi:hypothetical protein